MGVHLVGYAREGHEDNKRNIRFGELPAVRWHEVDLHTDPAMLTIIESRKIKGKGIHRQD